MSLRSIVKRILFRPIKEVPVYKPVYIPVLQADLLKGRKALITGGGSGIGYAIAEAFLWAGANVVISGRNADKLKAACAELAKIGNVSCVTLDNTKPDTFTTALDEIGIFDIVVNNAGYVGGGTFGNTKVEEYDKTLNTNLRGAYFLSQEVSKRWIANGVQGNILNLCSASSLRPGNSPYILSKWGLRSLTMGMARELIKYGIVVNGIAPGCTNTQQFCASDRKDINNPRNPTGRLVTMQEIANLSVVMVSDLAKMVVGDVLYVTGGGGITTLDD